MSEYERGFRDAIRFVYCEVGAQVPAEEIVKALERSLAARLSKRKAPR